MPSEPAYDGPRAEIGVIGGSGFYAFLDDGEHGRGRDAVRPAERPADRRRRSAAAASRSSRGTGATTGSRRTGSTTAPTSGRCARSASARCSRPCAVGSLQAEPRPGHARRPRPARRPHLGPRPDVLRRRRRRWSTSRSPTPTARRAAAAVAGRTAPNAGSTGRRRHPGRRQRAAVLHPRRVAVARRAGLVGGRHDRRTPRRSLARELASATPRSRWSPTSTPGSRTAGGVTHAEVLRVVRRAPWPAARPVISAVRRPARQP